MIRRLRARVTSAHLLAFAAVFIVLGGTAVAAKVGTNKLKANAVTTAKIADGAVTTAKLADNATTGAKVDESTLGPVPNAANATNATNAATAANATQLNSRALARVVSEVSSDETNPANDTPITGSFSAVLTATAFAGSAGPADVVAEAQLSFFGAANGTADCHLEIDTGGGPATFGVFSLASIPGANESTSMTLVGHADDVPSGLHEVTVHCREADANDITMDSGSLVVTSTPE